MKIFGFLQVRNEVASGHLERFLKENSKLFDHLFALDDGSSDQTPQLLEAAGAHVIRQDERNFQNEAINKAKLLEAIQEQAAEGDAILWLDADEVMYCSRSELEQLIESAFRQGFDSISFEHLNLWRSNFHFRTDDGYFGLRPVRIWKNGSGLRFERRFGLHQQTHPDGLAATFHSPDFPVFHYGFSTLEAILEKYARYHLDWQEGYPLDRLVTEVGRKLRHVSEFPGKLGGRLSSSLDGTYSEPTIIAELDWRFMARKAKSAAEATITPLITVVCLIFKSIDWLAFSYGEALKLRRDFRRGEVEVLFVANDASPEVLEFLRKNFIPYIESSGRESQDEWYINSVYRAYNEGALASTTPLVFLINSDMAFDKGALRNLYLRHESNQLLTSLLVERGYLVPGEHAIEMDFGSRPQNFRRQDFVEFARKASKAEMLSGGLFMPLLCKRSIFEEFGGFPEGNLRPSSIHEYLENGTCDFALPGEETISGDVAFFKLLETRGYEHITRLDSICYHFQEGELGSRGDRRVPSGIALKNDLVQGINGEEVLWSRLARNFDLEAGAGLISTGLPSSKLSHAFNPLRLALRASVRRRRHWFRVALSNATFQIPQRIALRDIVLVQDRPQGFLTRAFQKLAILMSDHVVSNDLQFATQRPKSSVFWFDVQIGPEFREHAIHLHRDKGNSPKRGLFVGALNSTKGEASLRQLVLENPQVDWTIISKYRVSPPAWVADSGTTFRTAQSHDEVLAEMRLSDFLVSTSPWETQHLASLEAVAQGLPVFITPTGLLGFQRQGWQKFGLVADGDIVDSFRQFLGDYPTFEPRGWFEEAIWSGEDELRNFILSVLQGTFEHPRRQNKVAEFLGRLKSYLLYRIRLFRRSVLIPFALRLLRKR